MIDDEEKFFGNDSPQWTKVEGVNSNYKPTRPSRPKIPPSKCPWVCDKQGCMKRFCV
eukprot:TRINITY_DN12963_c0_g1_i1.p4 TRINITY_DN12963_c0_g1~~TRINITY_DN12963_c0_g1_i1.p4  ORF type:complete len:57 (-),score=9.04 TRINITY_DN12963_c0_g1_i1:176-346(-)